MGFAKKLRKGEIKPIKSSRHKPKLILVLDDVYDTFNVGGMYRVGDAAGVSTIYHCGETPVPPNAKIERSSVGLHRYIEHKKEEDIIKLVLRLKKQGFKIVVLEQDERAVEFDRADYKKIIAGHSTQAAGKPSMLAGLALIVGNESFGVKKEVLDIADQIVELPMHGVNKSLNVVVAAGIVIYEIRRQLETCD